VILSSSFSATPLAVYSLDFSSVEDAMAYSIAVGTDYARFIPPPQGVYRDVEVV